MQTISFLVFLTVPILAASVIDTDAYVPFLILFFAIAGLSAAHPLYDGEERAAAEPPRQAPKRGFPSAAADRPAQGVCAR